MNLRTAVAAICVFGLAACGGGGPSGTAPAPTGGGGGTLAPANAAIAAANAIGSPLKAFATFEKTDFAAGSPAGGNVRSFGTSACTNGVKYSVPDLAGDANSSETQYFYDTACANIARDSVRVFQPSGSNSEIVHTSDRLYALQGVTPIAQRDDTTTITSPQFDGQGYPSRTAGFSRQSNGFLHIGNTATILSNYELIVAPAQSVSGANAPNSNAFCSDQAGFNAIGFSSGNTFGWTGLVTNGTRTVNSDGSVTWQGTHTGSGYITPIGAMSVSNSTPNTACPITTPAFTILGGGTPVGNHSIPYSATYTHGVLTALSITNATVVGGLSLNVSTAPGTSPQNDLFINGVLSNASGQVATFNVNAFGDGTLTIASTGNQFTITDWHVRE